MTTPRCPWAPWTFDTPIHFLRSFAVLSDVDAAEAYDASAVERALVHVARVKLRKVRLYLLGERVTPQARHRIELLIRNAGRKDLLRGVPR